METVLYVPVSSLIASINLLIMGGKSFEESVKLVANDLFHNMQEAGISNPEHIVYSFNEAVSHLVKLGNEGRIQGSLRRKVLSFGYLYFRGILRREANMLKRLVKHLRTSYDNIRFTYSMNENIEHALSLHRVSKAIKAPTGIMLQLPLYSYIDLLDARRIRPVVLASYQLNYMLRKTFLDLIEPGSKGSLKLVQAVSPVPLLESYDLVDMCRQHGIKLKVPVPGNAIDKTILRHRSLSERDAIAVYFGRLSPEKGLWDLLEIWRRVETTLPNARLMLAGSFQSERTRHRFWSLVERYGIRNLEYKGFLRHGEKLYRLVSQAKVLIYPSYRDTHPLTILEAVTLGLLAVAYRIPIIKYIYNDIPAVMTVNPGDINAASKLLIKALRMGHSEHLLRQQAPQTLNLIHLHSSWKNVAAAEFANMARSLLEGFH